MTNTELLQSISVLLDERFEKNNKELMQVIDERFEKNNKELMQVMDERFEKNNQKLMQAMDKRFESRERRLMNSILEEVDLVQEKANTHFERIEKRLDNLEITVRSLRSDMCIFPLLVEKITNLDVRVSKLEQKVS